MSVNCIVFEWLILRTTCAFIKPKRLNKMRTKVGICINTFIAHTRVAFTKSAWDQIVDYVSVSTIGKRRCLIEKIRRGLKKHWILNKTHWCSHCLEFSITAGITVSLRERWKGPLARHQDVRKARRHLVWTCVASQTNYQQRYHYDLIMLPKLQWLSYICQTGSLWYQVSLIDLLLLVPNPRWWACRFPLLPPEHSWNIPIASTASY